MIQEEKRDIIYQSPVMRKRQLMALETPVLGNVYFKVRNKTFTVMDMFTAMSVIKHVYFYVRNKACLLQCP